MIDKTIVETAAPWRAVFEDGPCKGSADRLFIVPPILNDLWMIPHPMHDGQYALARYTGIDMDPWPGEVHYLLSRVSEKVTSDDIEFVAHYKVQS